GIAWCKSTLNPWIGCTKIGPDCNNCYAETMDKRAVFDGVTHWGAGVPRKRTSEQNWNAVRRWNRIAPDTEFAGRKGFWPVFCASLADVFDNEVDPQWQHDLWNLIASTPNLTWLLLTKRIGNVARLVDPRWMEHGFPDNVWLGATVVNQEEADRDIPKLLQIPAKVRFLSVEPMLGPVDLIQAMEMREPGSRFNGWAELSWCICGGESGTKARPMHPDWARLLRDQCAAAGVPYFFKQWDGKTPHRLLDGVEHSEFPA
ncbi:MAG: phage Gp37/Gp68 family protein, partial [Gallionella sp.]